MLLSNMNIISIKYRKRVRIEKEVNEQQHQVELFHQKQE